MKGAFSVKEAGLVKVMNNLAFNYRLTYGITAVVIAILAGLLMGVVFKGGDGGH